MAIPRYVAGVLPACTRQLPRQTHPGTWGMLCAYALRSACAGGSDSRTTRLPAPQRLGPSMVPSQAGAESTAGQARAAHLSGAGPDERHTQGAALPDALCGWCFCGMLLRLQLSALTTVLHLSSPLHMQRKLSLTLKESFGDEAFRIMPRTFSLPDELDAWRQYMAAAGEAYDKQATANGSGSGSCQSSGRDEAAARADGGACSTSDPRQQLWILKTAQHLGKGLKLLPAEQAIQEAARNK